MINGFDMDEVSQAAENVRFSIEMLGRTTCIEYATITKTMDKKIERLYKLIDDIEHTAQKFNDRGKK